MSKLIKIRFKNEIKEKFFPKKATEKSSGLDIMSCEDVSIGGKEVKLVKTGFSLELPQNFEAQIRSRSGLAFKHGIVVLNSPGTIDEDYRGEIKVILYNITSEKYDIKKGDRIAQMVFIQLPEYEIKETKSLSNTERGEGGFGSTGIK